MKPGFFWWFQALGQETMGWGVSFTGDIQEPSGCNPMLRALGWPCLSREVGPDDSCGAFQPDPFCNGYRSRKQPLCPDSKYSFLWCTKLRFLLLPLRWRKYWKKRRKEKRKEIWYWLVIDSAFLPNAILKLQRCLIVPINKRYSTILSPWTCRVEP